MPCYSPLKGFRTPSGGVVFWSKDGTTGLIRLPCGQCVGCRLERSRQWAVRCVHEAQLHKVNSFVTLTYDEAHIPPLGSLRYEDFQLFMKRLRRAFAPDRIRFYMCGEYGEQTARPHYHALLFGLQFPDQVLWRRTGAGELIYKSEILNSLWGLGVNNSIGEVNFKTAAYCARYVMKKVTGGAASRHYERINIETGEVFHVGSEFNHMSLKPGIGGAWFDKYTSDVFPHDRVVINGKEAKPPRYYDQLYKRSNPDEFEVVAEDRRWDGLSRAKDNTDARLKVKEVVSNAGLRFFRRGLK